jgi:dihydroorotate dehydrogenase (NAD+) catalytic subunit
MSNSVNLSTELKTKHGTLELAYPVMNASGILCFPPVLKLCAPYLGAVVTKSIGPEPREGYKEPIVAYDPKIGLVNAVGLANPGCEEFEREIQESQFYPLAINGRRVPVIISIFGNTPEELSVVANSLKDFCDALELNFGCPNTFGNEKTGMVIGKDLELSQEYTDTARRVTNKPIIAKLTPNVNIEDIGTIAQAVVDGGADMISIINTVYPGKIVDPKGRYILKRGEGSISGPKTKEKSLELIREICNNVSIPIIGMGGIESAHDILDYTLVGANAVAIGTGFMGMNTREREIFLTQLYKNLGSLIKKRGYSSLKEMLDNERRTS